VLKPQELWEPCGCFRGRISPGQKVCICTCSTCRVAAGNMGFQITDICKHGLSIVTDTARMESYRGKGGIGNQVETVSLMRVTEVGAEDGSGGRAGLSLGGCGKGAEGAFYGWCANQPWSVSSRIAGSWFVLTASSKRVENSCCQLGTCAKACCWIC
jgi:hypothetical protein